MVGIQQFAASACEQVGGIFTAELLGYGGYGLCQQGAVGAHVLPVLGCLVKQLAQLGVGLGLPLAQGAKQV